MKNVAKYFDIHQPTINFRDANTIIMDDFGDILYILVLLGGLIFSIYKKSKQGKQGSPMPSDTSSESFDPMDEEINIEDLRDLFKPRKPEPVPVTPKPAPAPKMKPTKQDVTRVRVKPKSTDPLEVIDLDEESSSDIGYENIDLRQAVIYSEILKRPYQ